MDIGYEPRRGAVEWFREIGDPWMIKGNADRRPQPGSDLLADGPNAASVAHHSIIMALDQLGSVVDAMVSGEPMRHYAPFTILRTVLLASARAMWMLLPDTSHERQTRCLRIEYINLDEQRKAFKTISGAAATEELKRQADQILSDFEAPMQEFNARAPELGMAKLTAPPDTVTMLQQLVPANTPEGYAAQHLWRVGSSTAHGYYWSDTQRPNPHLFDEKTFDTALYVATLFVKEAMKLYEQRATGRGH
ncbi:hypothetical protein FHR72_005174 [Mycolicibacterium iranicum]|uniref:Uncharacterized protein n=1 Tax=Mycolicibacterium iranicum TaxID=912594 RepID=A0A839QDI2_MYCIR|nr:hypothetical protein [Mycolicibacterium iranicum]MBB2993663.1 hypothetical protein [Mycolicibacterium iranicum]